MNLIPAALSGRQPTPDASSQADASAPPSSHDPQRERTGVLLVLLEDLVWGLFPVLTKGIVSGVDPILAAGVSSLVASLPFLVALAVRGRLPLLWKRSTLPALLLIALFSQVLASLCFFVGTARTSALNASLLSQIEPLYALVLAALVLKEAIGRRQVAATLLLVAGAVSVVYDGQLALQSGDLLVLLTPLWYQLGHLIAKRLFARLETPLVIPAMRLGLGGLILLSIALLRDPAQTTTLMDASRLAPLVAFGLLFIALEKLLWYEALRRIDLARATALLVPSVAVGVLGSFLLLGEQPRAGHLIGLLLMVVGLHQLTRRPATL